MIKCEKCDATVKNTCELKKHDHHYHSHSRGIQYERNVEPFNCYYCEITINSEESLKTHNLDCQSKLNEIFQSNVNQNKMGYFNCEICEAKFPDNFEKHWKDYHCLETASDESESFRCNVCPLKYKKKIDLDFHVRGFHWGLV